MFDNPNGVPNMDDINLDNLSPEMQADLNAYYDWLEDMSGEQELPEDFDLR